MFHFSQASLPTHVRFCLILGGIVVAGWTGLRAETALTTSDPVVYQVRMTTSLRIPGRINTDRLRVWHALPNRRNWSLFTGGVGATGIQFSSGGKQEYESEHDSHHVLWETRDRLNPGDVHRFLSQFEVRSMRRVLLPGKAVASWEAFDTIPPSIRLASEVNKEEIHERLQAEGDRIKFETTPYDAILAFSKWVEKTVRYNASVTYPSENIRATLTKTEGHCGHRAATFRQLCGAVGIPVRTIWGLNLYEEDGKGELHKIRPDYTNIHTWVEVYMPGAGWVEVDPASKGNPFSIPSHYIRNNTWFQNYSVWVGVDGQERQPQWTFQDGKFVSDYHVEHVIEFRSIEE